MFSSSTFKGVFGTGSKVAKTVLLVFLFTTVCAEATEGSATIARIKNFDTASLVTIDAGYESGMRKGMKLIAFSSQEAIAELVVLDVNKEKTETLITDLFGHKALMLGNQVKFKTINFAATWK